MESVTHYFNDEGVVFVTTKTLNDQGEVIEENKTSYTPNSNISGLPQDIQDECTAAWTTEVVDAFFAKVNAL